jgi:hypothetical protein
LRHKSIEPNNRANELMECSVFTKEITWTYSIVREQIQKIIHVRDVRDDLTSFFIHKAYYHYNFYSPEKTEVIIMSPVDNV